ncbi:hypothetical protein [Corynebacterium sp. A21]|uniref:hypothetical protein n=1 Tax=Corynebacterium sp. A21 TaxID=3457318 RepID=UPI003FD6B624
MNNGLPDTPRNPDEKNHRQLEDGTPRWVKISGIIVLVLIVLIVLVMVFGGGNHGPGRHGLGMPASGMFLIQDHL